LKFGGRDERHRRHDEKYITGKTGARFGDVAPSNFLARRKRGVHKRFSVWHLKNRRFLKTAFSPLMEGLKVPVHQYLAPTVHLLPFPSVMEDAETPPQHTTHNPLHKLKQKEIKKNGNR